jgi:hypothetical protein
MKRLGSESFGKRFESDQDHNAMNMSSTPNPILINDNLKQRWYCLSIYEHHPFLTQAMSHCRLSRICQVLVLISLCLSCDDQVAEAQPVIFASAMKSFTPGKNAGFGQSKLPDIVLGAPKGAGKSMGSFDVLSLGIGGEIILSFSQSISNGEGDDFWVFENVFYREDKAEAFRELAEISVSENGIDFVAFRCDPMMAIQGDLQACAGIEASIPCDFDFDLSSGACGGDAFDLAHVGMEEARFVKIKDLGLGMGLTAITPSAGFDLDGIAVRHYLSR